MFIIKRIEIKVFYKIKDNVVTDNEYLTFFRLIIEPFQNCDTNQDNNLNTEELYSCVHGYKFNLKIGQIWKNSGWLIIKKI